MTTWCYKKQKMSYSQNRQFLYCGAVIQIEIWRNK